MSFECPLPSLFVLSSLLVHVPLVHFLVVMSYFSSQLCHLLIPFSFTCSSTVKKPCSEAGSPFLGLVRWVKNISTRGNHLGGFRGSQAVCGSELAVQSSTEVADMTQSLALDQHYPDHKHLNQGPSSRPTQTLHVLPGGEKIFSFEQSTCLLETFTTQLDMTLRNLV